MIPKLRADNELGCPKRGWLVETESHERLFVIQAPMILRQPEVPYMPATGTARVMW